MKNKPIVTVLMPVYNAEKYLQEAIESILNQTFSNFELLIIDDCSTDKSCQIIQQINDSRIKLVKNDIHSGMSQALNKGLKMALGSYIARMDADDISLPERLSYQVDFLENNPSVDIVGSQITQLIDNQLIECKFYPLKDEEIKLNLFFHLSSFCHPVVMFRKKSFEKYQIQYKIDELYAQDYGVWMRNIQYLRMANHEAILLHYRVHTHQISTAQKSSQALEAQQILKEYLVNNIPNLNNAEIDLHIQLCFKTLIVNFSSLKNVAHWFKKILIFNQQKTFFNQVLSQSLLGKKWFELCGQNSQLGLSIWWVYIRSGLFKYHKIGWKNHISFLIACLRHHPNHYFHSVQNSND